MYPRNRSLRVALFVGLVGCGARSGLGLPDDETTSSTTTGSHASSTATGMGGMGGNGGSPPCIDGTTQPCGSDVGACQMGIRKCTDTTWGPCEGDIGPTDELCNDIDDNCDGQIDDGFGLGQACDGPDLDQCLDDVMTCAGCTAGPTNVETCNGFDDNCNGIVDADCTVGDCQPTLIVTGSMPSSPSCIDFPVEAGSTGMIEYPCGGGMVTAQLGSVSFSGSVTNGFVSLDGVVIIPPSQSPDGCTWQTNHHIQGTISSGVINYSYSEMHISGNNCWNPCTEVGTVQINWVP
jgi:hypothetical protein